VLKVYLSDVVYVADLVTSDENVVLSDVVYVADLVTNDEIVVSVRHRR